MAHKRYPNGEGVKLRKEMARPGGNGATKKDRPEVRAKMRKVWQDPDVRERRRQAIIEGQRKATERRRALGLKGRANWAR